jgi:hypothetical protein
MTMQRINLTIPDDLRAQMREFESEVSWSAIATDAFRAKIGQLTVRNANKAENMDTVIERLRASKQAYVDDAETRGATAGIDWAKGRAEFIQLKNLSDKIERNPHDEWNVSNVPETTDPDFIGSRADVREWWMHAAQLSEKEVDTIPEAFIEGFVKGAMGVFEEVEDEL